LCLTTQAAEDGKPEQVYYRWVSYDTCQPPATFFSVKSQDYYQIPFVYIDALKAIPQFRSLCQAIYSQGVEFIFVKFDDTHHWPASWNSDEKRITISRAFMATNDEDLRNIDTIEALTFEACNAASTHLPIILNQTRNATSRTTPFIM